MRAHLPPFGSGLYLRRLTFFSSLNGSATRPGSFWVCEKSDGVRVLVLIVATGFGQEVYLVRSRMNKQTMSRKCGAAIADPGTLPSVVWRARRYRSTARMTCTKSTGSRSRIKTGKSLTTRTRSSTANS